MVTSLQPQSKPSIFVNVCLTIQTNCFSKTARGHTLCSLKTSASVYGCKPIYEYTIPAAVGGRILAPQRCCVYTRRELNALLSTDAVGKPDEACIRGSWPRVWTLDGCIPFSTFFSTQCEFLISSFDIWVLSTSWWNKSVLNHPQNLPCLCASDHQLLVDWIPVFISHRSRTQEDGKHDFRNHVNWNRNYNGRGNTRKRNFFSLFF